MLAQPPHYGQGCLPRLFLILCKQKQIRDGGSLQRREITNARQNPAGLARIAKTLLEK